MRHEDDRRLQELVELLELDPQLVPQHRVEVGQGFIEQEDLGGLDHRAAHRDTLLLAARQLFRLAVEQRRDGEDLGHALDAVVDLGTRHFEATQPERHVVVDRHVRVERVVLEHHGDPAVARRDIVDDPSVDAQRRRPRCSRGRRSSAASSTCRSRSARAALRTRRPRRSGRRRATRGPSRIP